MIAEQDQLNHELKEITMRVSSKDAEIAIHKVELLKAQIEGPGTSDVQELHRENVELRSKIAALQEKL